MVIRKLAVTKLLVLLSLATVSASALAETQQEIEARIRALNAELYDLHQQLQQIDTPQDAAQGLPFEQLPEEAAREDLSERRELEQESSRNPFSITTHRTNYLFPVSYNANQNRESFRNISDDSEVDSVELKFQFSAKVNLSRYLVTTETSSLAIPSVVGGRLTTLTPRPLSGKPTTNLKCLSTSIMPGGRLAG